jgi:multidrug efflux pump subunit AcrB
LMISLMISLTTSLMISLTTSLMISLMISFILFISLMKTMCFQHFLKHFSFAKLSYRFEKKLQRRRKFRLRHRRRSSFICWMSRWCMKRTLFFKSLYLVKSILNQLRTTKKFFISSIIKWTWKKKLENLQMQKSLHVIWSISRQRWWEISLNQMKKHFYVE